MKVQKMAYIFFLASLFSCSDENLSNNDLSNGEPLLKVQNSSDRIGKEEAMNQVNEVIAFLDREHPSEFKSNRKVNSVSALLFTDIKSSILKSNEDRALEISDTLAYVFNFEDSLGYAIVSNDKRIGSPLFAFVKKGSLVNGNTDNPGLALFLKMLEGYVLKSIKEYDKTAGQKFGPTSIPLDTVVKPLVPVEWGQHEPFWLKLTTPLCPYGYFVTGCVATTMAHIMSYWEYPNDINNISINWTNLNKYKHKVDFDPSPTDNSIEIAKKKFTRSAVSSLFQQIGASVNMKYGCDVSLAYNSDAISFLVSKGFNSQNLAPFPYSNTVALAVFYTTFIISKKPLIVQGCDIYGRGCHSWVIDGLAGNSNSRYLHNNWGWDGYDNGYYLSGVFDPSYNFQDIYFASVYR